MVERQSATDGYIGALETDGAAPVAIAPLRPAAIAMVTAFPRTDRAVRTALRTMTSLAVPKAGRFAGDDNATVAVLSPGRYLLLSSFSDLVADLRAAVAAEDAAITDLGHARTILRVSGEGADELLMKGIMLDLSAPAFPARSVAQTILHHMDITLLRRSATLFDLAVFRGFAVSLLEWLTDAAGASRFGTRPGR